MKKIVLCILCLIMLVGCKSTSSSSLSYEEAKKKVEDTGIVLGLFPGGPPNMNCRGEGYNIAIVMDEDYEVEMIMDIISGENVGKEEAMDLPAYKEILEKSGLTQEELNELAKQFYQNNIDQALEEFPYDE